MSSTPVLYHIWSTEDHGWRQWHGIGYTTDISRAGYWDERKAVKIAKEANSDILTGHRLKYLVYPCQVLNQIFDDK